MGDFERTQELNKKFLDSLDLGKYISQSKDVQEIINMIEDDYDDSSDLPDWLEGCIFNYLGKEDIAHYLADRYGFHVHKQVICEYTLLKMNGE